MEGNNHESGSKAEQAAGKGKEIAQSPKLLIDRNAKGKEGFGGGVNSTPN